MSDSVRPYGQQPTRPICPWDSPGKNSGVGCHFLLPGKCYSRTNKMHLRKLCYFTDFLKIFAVDLNLCLIVESWLFEGDNPYKSLYWPPLWESVIGSSMFLSRVRKVVWEANLAYNWEFVEELVVEGRLQDCLLEVFWDPNPWELNSCRVCIVTTGCWVILTLVMECRFGGKS